MLTDTDLKEGHNNYCWAEDRFIEDGFSCKPEISPLPYDWGEE